MPERPELRPATERVRGGLSARLIGFVALAALLSVAWFGLSGRSDPLPPVTSPTTSAAAIAAPPPSASRRPGPSHDAPAPGSTRERLLSPARSTGPRLPPQRGLGLGDDFFAVTLVIEERVHFVLLHEQTPGELSGDIRLRFATAPVSGELELVQLWTRDERPNFVPIATYELVLPAFERGSEATNVVLEAQQKPRKKAREAPRLVRAGYRVTVRTETRRDRALLFVEIKSPAETSASSPRLPLIVLVAHHGAPRASQPFGHSWLAGE